MNISEQEHIATLIKENFPDKSLYEILGVTKAADENGICNY